MCNCAADKHRGFVCGGARCIDLGCHSRPIQPSSKTPKLHITVTVDSVTPEELKRLLDHIHSMDSNSSFVIHSENYIREA